MAVARGEAGFWPLKAILVLGRPGTGWNQKTIQKKSSRSNSAVYFPKRNFTRKIGGVEHCNAKIYKREEGVHEHSFAFGTRR